MRFNLHLEQFVTKGIPDGQHEVRAILKDTDVMFVLATKDGFIPLPKAMSHLLLAGENKNSEAPKEESHSFVDAFAASSTPPQRLNLTFEPQDEPQENNPTKEVEKLLKQNKLPAQLKEVTSNDEIWRPEPDEEEDELKKLNLL